MTAKLGFPEAKGAAKAPPRAPFIAEPAVVTPAVAPVKEIAADRFVLTAAPPVSSPRAEDGESTDDPNGPRLELTAPARIDSQDEKTVTTTLTLKNVGRREARLHVRRDNLLFDIDGPDGSSHCGLPSSRRVIPRELMGALGARRLAIHRGVDRRALPQRRLRSTRTLPCARRARVSPRPGRRGQPSLDANRDRQRAGAGAYPSGTPSVFYIAPAGFWR